MILQHTINVGTALGRERAGCWIHEPQLAEARQHGLPVSAQGLALGVTHGIDAAVQPLQDPVPLRLVGPGPRREPWCCGIQREALCRMRPDRREDLKGLHVPRDRVWLRLAGVVLPDLVGDDHVAQPDVASLPSADAAHREAAHGVLLEQAGSGHRRTSRAHAQRLGDADGQRTPLAFYRAHRDPVVVFPRCGTAARVDRLRVLDGDRRHDEDVERRCLRMKCRLGRLVGAANIVRRVRGRHRILSSDNALELANESTRPTHARVTAPWCRRTSEMRPRSGAPSTWWRCRWRPSKTAAAAGAAAVSS